MNGNNVFKIDRSSAVISYVMGTGAAASADGTGVTARFNYPIGITTDGSYLYVTDFHSNIIRKIY